MNTLLTATLAAAVSASIIKESAYEFLQYVAEHGKTYATAEEWALR